MAETGRDRAMGELIQTRIDLRVDDAKVDERVYESALDWTLSEETRETMREIDASIRAAEQMSGSLLVG